MPAINSILIHIAHNYETEVNEEIARNYSGDPIRKHLLARNAAKTDDVPNEHLRGIASWW